MVYNRRGLALWHHGDPEGALSELQEAERHAREAENQIWVPAHRTNQALALADLGRFDEAQRRFEESRKAHVENGSEHWNAVNYGGWGRALMLRNLPDTDDLEMAVEYLGRANEVARRIYYPESVAMHAGDMARAHMLGKDPSRARPCVAEAIALERRMEAVRDHRHFSNLVTMARCAAEESDGLLLWECLSLAADLAERLALDEESPVQTIRQDLAHLGRLLYQWRRRSDLERAPTGRLGLPPAAGQAVVGAESLIRNFDALHGSRTALARAYPWGGIEDALRSENLTSLPLFGYGSLMQLDSAKSTFPDLVEGDLRPAVGVGLRRLLDYDMPDDVRRRSTYASEADSLDRGLFNAVYTGSVTDCANGVLVDVPLDEIRHLREREVGYDLHAVICLPWNDKEGVPIEALALGCAPRVWNGRMLTNPRLRPHRDYYRRCREGAAGVSDEFLELFLDTAYLADGITTVREWEQAT